MMKERPILFSTEMVQAILAGRKTQTRRVIKPQVGNVPGATWAYFNNDNLWHHSSLYYCEKRKCPYGVPGDRLWVRETWTCLDKEYHPIKDGLGYPVYKADHIFGNDGPSKIKWRPSIHMPKKYARIWLEVKDVRVERVQEITNIGALDEGVQTLANDSYFAKYFPEYFQSYLEWEENGKGEPPLGPSPKERFAKLWDIINAKRGYGWDVNPWVWVVEFEKI